MSQDEKDRTAFERLVDDGITKERYKDGTYVHYGLNRDLPIFQAALEYERGNLPEDNIKSISDAQRVIDRANFSMRKATCFILGDQMQGVYIPEVKAAPKGDQT